MEDREPIVPKTEEERVANIDKAALLIIRELDESMRADDTLNLVHDGVLSDLAFEKIKPGRVMMLEYLVGYNATNACTYIRVGYWNGHAFNWLNTQPAPLVQETVGIGRKIHLREGMYPVIRFEGGANGDDIHAAINGYWIKTR